MSIENFIEQLRNTPESIEFNDTMSVIDEYYTFSPTSFINGTTYNEAGENNGSCKLFAFAQLQKLSEQETLACFGAYYRDDVLKNPEADNHQNIRNFMQKGWSGIKMAGEALSNKSPKSIG